MGVLRKNTLVVDFSVLPKRPDVGKVEEFLEKKVKLNLEDTITIQLHNLRNCVYIETIDNETALRYERLNCNKHTFVYNNKEFRIPIYVESEAVTVRVHDLPSHINHLTVADFMGQYGVVISVSRERWKNHFAGYYNGVRVLRMKLNRPIPSTVTIDGETSLVTYPKQPKICRHCGQSAHPKEKCAPTPKTISTPISTVSPPQVPQLAAPPMQAAQEEIVSNPNLDSVPQTQTEIGENNTTSDKGDSCDDDDDDENNSSSDTSEFIETPHQKRRISNRVMQKSGETKKICLNNNLDVNSNRFQALVKLDDICPSAAEMLNYSNRHKNKKCNSST